MSEITMTDADRAAQEVADQQAQELLGKDVSGLTGDERAAHYAAVTVALRARNENQRVLIEDLRPQLQSLRDELAIVRGSIDERLAEARRPYAEQIERLQGEFDQFRDRVREEAYRVQRSQGWCDDGLRSTLANLDLEPRVNTYRVTAEVTATRTFTFEVQARDGEQAWHDVDAMTESEVQELLDAQGVQRHGLFDEWDFGSIDCSTNTELVEDGDDD